MRLSFQTYKDFTTAVAAAGLRTRMDPPSHEGPHADDQFEPSVVIDADGAEYGIGGNRYEETGEITFVGELFTTPDEYTAWENEQRNLDYEAQNAH